MLYDATVNDPLPSAREAAVVTMGFFAEKAKKFTAERGTYALATNPGRWSNSTPRPIWWSVGAVLRLLLEKNDLAVYHGFDVLR